MALYSYVALRMSFRQLLNDKADLTDGVYTEGHCWILGLRFIIVYPKSHCCASDCDADAGALACHL